MRHEWGMLIVLYLFLGGLSAGLLALSTAATLGRRLARVASVAAWTAPWPVLAGTGLLVLDLGQPFYFWKLLVSFEPRSPMWLGTWLLTLFALVSIPYAGTFLPDWLTGWDASRVGQIRRRLAAAGLPLGLAVGIYTGVLLGVLVARPLWNTPLLAQLFLVSALSSAAAFVMLLGRRAATAADRRVLAGLDAALIAIELLVLGGMFLEAGTSPVTASIGTSVLLGGVYAWTFWIGVVFLGLAVPLGIEIVELFDLVRPSGAGASHLAALASALVLAGGFLLRWVFVYAGQVSRL